MDTSTLFKILKDYKNFHIMSNYLEIRDEPYAHLKYVAQNFGSVKVCESNLTYPNYPLVYNFNEESDFTDENLEDFIQIVRTSLAKGNLVETYTVVSCLFQYYWLQESKGRKLTCSKQLALMFECFILSYSRNFFIDTVTFRSTNLPFMMLHHHWYRMYDCINLNDFLDHVVPPMYGMNSILNNCTGYTYKVNDLSVMRKTFDSFTFFIVTMRMLIRAFFEITSDLKKKLIDAFKNFIVVGNYLMALPFSFFASSYTLKRYVVIQDELELAAAHRIALDFMLGFRNVKKNKAKHIQKFTEFVPNYRYLNFKMNSVLSTFNYFGKKYLKKDDIRFSMKILGMIPFKNLTKVKLDDREREIVSSTLDSCQFFDAYDNEDAKDLYRCDEKDYSYFTDKMKIYSTNVKTSEEEYDSSDSTDGADESDDKIPGEKFDNCSLCLDAPSTIISLPCLHRVSCRSCHFRISNQRCPVCRCIIRARLSSEYAQTYDKLQLCILTETYSMFCKMIINN